MKLKLLLFVVAISLVVCNACDEDDKGNSKPISTSINKIMPLGASRVEGARPDFESYRFYLWQSLQENDWTFDFIGSQSDDASYPSVDGASFDIDHEGRGGWTSGQILEGLEGWLDQTGPADIVLLSSPGGNDALLGLPIAQAVANINAIIDILQFDNPNVTVIIEQMAPGRTDIMTAERILFFEQMHQEVVVMATNQSTATSQVIAVDMFTGFDNSLLADEVHYNEAGAEFIANRYYIALVDILESE